MASQQQYNVVSRPAASGRVSEVDSSVATHAHVPDSYAPLQNRAPDERARVTLCRNDSLGWEPVGLESLHYFLKCHNF